MAPAPVVIDWGERSRVLQARLRNKVSGPSFWLTPSRTAVMLGLLAPNSLATWETATLTPIQLTPVRQNTTAVEGLISTMPALARLDFSLSASAGGQTRVVLAFQQLFVVDSFGGLMASQYAMEDVTFAPSPAGPTRQRGPSFTGFRRFLGQHPLVSATPGRVAINAEFVDATELWWAIHAVNDNWGWYLNPALGGRQENLRVLAWTGGGAPMIWFVVVPDAAVHSLDPTATSSSASGAVGRDAQPPKPAAANLVFFRPVPGSNSIFYSPTAEGFANPSHANNGQQDGKTTLHILARYLLSPLPAEQLSTISSLVGAEFLTDQIQPTNWRAKLVTPMLDATPDDPMAIAGVLWAAFVPVGLEAIMNRVNQPHVMFLPLGWDASGSLPDGGYDAAVRSDLRTTLDSALYVLWNTGVIARDANPPPDLRGRELWIAGHSAGNLSVWACLKNNDADVDRVISVDSTPRDTSRDGRISGSLVPVGLPALKQAAKKRASLGKRLDAFMITSPNMIHQVETASPNVIFTGLDDATDLLLRRTGAAVTVLPDFSERKSYWQVAPAAAMNPFLRPLLGNWTDRQIERSALTPDNWYFLFFHELAVYGGHRNAPTPTSPSTLRTFFEDALGAPNPRPIP